MTDWADMTPAQMGRLGELITLQKGRTMLPVGPVADGFRKDRSVVSTIMGPYGSAKTTTCFQKIINSAIWQPKCRDGYRRVRWCIVRDTYGHLETNVMADWFLWFPKHLGKFNQRTNSHVFQMVSPLANGEELKLEIEILFRAVDTQSAEELFKGMSLTGLWANEMDTLHRDIFKFGFPRLGRYKPGGLTKPGWSGFIGDMNAPDTDNWTYDFCENKNIGLSDEEMRGFRERFGDDFAIKFHKQPGGMEPNAENLANLPDGYYERMQIGMDDNQRRRFIHNKFGAVRDGNPVYSQYSDERHSVAGLIRPIKGLPVYLAIDGGNTPAALFAQKLPTGQIQVQREVVVYQPDKEKGLARMGPYEFGVQCGEFWNANYAGHKLADISWADPSAWYGGGTKHDEDKAWIDRFVDGFNKTALGARVKMKPAPIKGNRLTPRLEAVREQLRGTIDAKASFVISAAGCPVLRQGFNSGYVTTRVGLSTGGGRWKDEPEKNDFSHVHDALQYLVLGMAKFDGWEEAEDRAHARQSGPMRRVRVNAGTGYFAQGASR